MVRIRLLITSPNQPPTFEITVTASSAASTAPAISSTVRTAVPVSVSPPTAAATVSVAWPIRKGTASPAPAVSTEHRMIVVYSGARARVKRTRRSREDPAPAWVAAGLPGSVALRADDSQQHAERGPLPRAAAAHQPAE